MALSEGFFDKFRKILSANIGVKKKFVDICKDRYQISLKEDEIVFKDSIISIKASNAVKNKIFLIKGSLLKDLKDQNVTIYDIRF